MSSASLPPAPPPELAARIRAAIEAEPTPSKVRMPVRVGLGAAGVFAILLVTSFVFRIRAVGDDAFGDLLVTSAAATLLALAALGSAMSPGKSGLGLPSRALLVVAVITPLLYCAATVAHPVAGVGTTAVGDGMGHFCSKAWPCLAIAGVISLASCVVLFGALRHAVPVAPRLRGAAVGAASAAWAGVALHLHCPQIDRAHLLVAHAMPIVLFALLGAWLAPRLIKP